MSNASPHDPPVIHAPLLDALLRADAPISIESLALRVNLSRDAVRKEIDRLLAAGCTISTHPQHGLRLTLAGLGTWADYLQHYSRFPRIIEVYRQTASTQETCRRIIETRGREAHGALALAHHQTAGRGRLGRAWCAPSGFVATFSRAHLLEQTRSESPVDRLTFATAVAVAEAADKLLCGRACTSLKWPNDIYIDGRKLAGILVEVVQTAAGPAAIIGVGFNTSLTPGDLPTTDLELRQHITSLAMHEVHVDRLRVLSELINAMDHALEDQPLEDLLRTWRDRCITLHQHIEVRCNGKHVAGQVIDLDPHEGLILRTNTGELLHLPAAVTTVV